MILMNPDFATMGGLPDGEVLLVTSVEPRRPGNVHPKTSSAEGHRGRRVWTGAWGRGQRGEFTHPQATLPPNPQTAKLILKHWDPTPIVCRTTRLPAPGWAVTSDL